MTHFETFDSFEAMQDRMRTAELEAMESLNDHQRALLTKTKFFWMSPRMDLDLTIFGEYDLPTLLAREVEGWDPEDGSPTEHVAHIERNNLVRGYKSGRAFSTWEPGGEYGDTHIAAMWEISEQAFAEAKAVGWDIPKRTAECPTLRREIIAHIVRDRES